MLKYTDNLYRKYNNFSSPYHRKIFNLINRQDNINLFDFYKIYFYDRSSSLLYLNSKMVR